MNLIIIGLNSKILVVVKKPVVDKEIFADAKALFLIASNVNAHVPAMTALL